MIIDDEAYLNHHGVLGMHWGIRRDPKTGVRPLARKLDQSRFGKASKNNADRYNSTSKKKKIAGAVGIGLVGVGVATIAGYAILNRNLHAPISVVRATNISRGTEASRKLLDVNKAKHMALISDINKRRFVTNAAANEDLKKLYNLNDTPIHLRDYLPVN